MGAQLWYHAAPWFPDPNEALLVLQTKCLADCFSNPAEYIRNDLEWTRGLVRKHEAERDRYGLLDMYRRKVALLEKVHRQGVPEEARHRIELARQLCRLDGAEGVGNIVDVVTTSPTRGLRVAEVLTTAECRRLVGAARPTRRQAEAAIYRIHAELGRGECVCFRSLRRRPRKNRLGGISSVIQSIESEPGRTSRCRCNDQCQARHQ